MCQYTKAVSHLTDLQVAFLCPRHSLSLKLVDNGYSCIVSVPQALVVISDRSRGIRGLKEVNNNGMNVDFKFSLTGE